MMSESLGFRVEPLMLTGAFLRPRASGTAGNGTHHLPLQPQLTGDDIASGHTSDEVDPVPDLPRQVPEDEAVDHQDAEHDEEKASIRTCFVFSVRFAWGSPSTRRRGGTFAPGRAFRCAPGVGLSKERPPRGRPLSTVFVRKDFSCELSIWHTQLRRALCPQSLQLPSRVP